MINRNATIEEKGYDPDTLSHGSGKKVCAVCDECGEVRWIPFHAYRDLCFTCAKKGERNSFFNKKHTEQSRKKMSENHAGGVTIHSEETKLKIRDAHKGRKKSNSHCMNMRGHRVSMSGKNHPNWKGGVSSEHKLFMGTIEYSKWRLAVFNRDNFTCQECGDSTGGNLNAHHLLPYRDWKDEQYSLNLMNGITLCKNCHKETFGREYEFFSKYFDVANGVGV